MLVRHLDHPLFLHSHIFTLANHTSFANTSPREDNAVVAALAPVAERLARRPRTPTDAAPACAVAIERALADEAVVAVVARTPDAEAHNALVADAEAHVVVATAALAPVAELSCALICFSPKILEP